jgi:hypothetical protein
VGTLDAVIRSVQDQAVLLAAIEERQRSVDQVCRGSIARLGGPAWRLAAGKPIVTLAAPGHLQGLARLMQALERSPAARQGARGVAGGGG